MERYERATAYADRIEQELRKLGVWQTEPLPDEAFESQKAFFADTMSFYQWLQFVLLARIREIVRERAHFPKTSEVGAYAVRELDGSTEAGELIQVLAEFDDWIEGR